MVLDRVVVILNFLLLRMCIVILKLLLIFVEEICIYLSCNFGNVLNVEICIWELVMLKVKLCLVCMNYEVLM